MLPSFHKKKLLIFVSCDSIYFNSYFFCLYNSAKKNSKNINIWVNIINPTTKDIDSIKLMKEKAKTNNEKIRIFYSLEYKDFYTPYNSEEYKKAYYASSRYIKLYKLVCLLKMDILALDIDSIILRDISRLRYKMNLFGYDIAIRTRFKEKNIKLKFAIGTFYARYTKNTKKFLLDFSNKIRRNLLQNKLEWFLDQRLCYETYQDIKKEIRLYKLPSKYADWDFNSSSIIWAGKGPRKNSNKHYLKKELSFTKGDERPKKPLIKEGYKLNVAIFLPKLDLPFKKPKIEQTEKMKIAMRNSDTGELRKYWQDFAEIITHFLKNNGYNAELIIKPMWEITPALVNSYNLDLAFIPHKQYYQFKGTECNVYYYMQVIFRWLFSCDHWGWSAGNSMYPNDYSEGDENSGTFELYKKKLEGSNISKFGQPKNLDKDQLIKNKQIPEGDYIFFPCQIPHDQSIQLFSDFEEKDVIKSLVQWSKKSKVPIVFKSHPVNPKSCKIFKEIAKGKNIYWSDASIHDLISNSKAVYTINSGVGFEAMFYNKPIVTFGKIEYDAVTIHANLHNLKEVWQKVLNSNSKVRLKNYKKFIDWYCRIFCIDLSADQESLNERLQLFISRLNYNESK